MVSLQDLSFLQHREFKVHRGQVGDSTSEIIQGVPHIIKPEQFEGILINKDNLTLSELRSFVWSHLSEVKCGSELFQELMSTKQHQQSPTLSIG